MDEPPALPVNPYAPPAFSQGGVGSLMLAAAEPLPTPTIRFRARLLDVLLAVPLVLVPVFVGVQWEQGGVA
jgi:hypothetical protein